MVARRENLDDKYPQLQSGDTMMREVICLSPKEFFGLICNKVIVWLQQVMVSLQKYFQDCGCTTMRCLH